MRHCFWKKQRGKRQFVNCVVKRRGKAAGALFFCGSHWHFLLKNKEICTINFGLAGWMQQQTGAPVWISEPDYAMAERVWGEESVQTGEVAALFRRHGVPDGLVADIEESMEKLSLRVSPFPVLTVLADDEIVIGQRRWTFIPVPGHSDGLVSFYQPESRQLLVSDHVLDRITPNIGVWPGAHPNPLEQYFVSLRNVEALHVEVALPAHGATCLGDRELRLFSFLDGGPLAEICPAGHHCADVYRRDAQHQRRCGAGDHLLSAAGERAGRAWHAVSASARVDVPSPAGQNVSFVVGPSGVVCRKRPVGGQRRRARE